MFRLATLSAFVIFGIATVGHASITECARVSELAAARARWGIGKIKASGSAHKQEVCRAYVGYFTEAVLTRHASFVCGQGGARKRDLDVVDSEIESVNNIIAAHCGP